jgi:hypothetical protein
MNTTAAIAREPWRPSQASAADMALRTGMVGNFVARAAAHRAVVDKASDYRGRAMNAMRA